MTARPSASLSGHPAEARKPLEQKTRRRFLRRTQGLLAAGALAALLVPALHAMPMRFVWNASASVPVGLYWIEPTANIRVGDLVLVRPSPALEALMAERRYVEYGVPLLKSVAAVAGATACRTKLSVTIDGHAAAVALPTDRLGRPLPRWTGCRRLRPDEFFLIAPASAASFDSRYFGPVTRTQIIGRAIPVWTWR
jgi:conjugative transfer signal peptidase TraF